MTRQRAAVITGSTKGWGLAVARGLAAKGVAVVINGRGEDVDGVVQSITGTGGAAVGARYSSDNAEGVDRLLAEGIEAFGGVDIWVNSLGIQRPQLLLEMDLETWNEILRVQLTAYFLGTQRAARQMIKQGKGGRILNVVGGGAYGIPGASAHAASKGGALSATYSWASELRKYGITVNGIRGGVRSPSMRIYLQAMGHIGASDSTNDEVMRRFGFYAPEEAAPLATWLSSEEVDDVTGFHIGIDGSRIVVYERVGMCLEMEENDGWTEEALNQRLRPALLNEARKSGPVSQRRPPDGQLVAFDDRSLDGEG